MIHNPCQGTGIQVAHFFNFAQMGHKASIIMDVFLVSWHAGIEISLYLEQFIEVLIKSKKHFVNIRASDQDHLYIQWDWLRSEALGGGKAQFLAYIFNFQAIIGQSSFQSIPCQWLPDQFIDGHNDISTICLVKRSSPNKGEIRHQGTEPGFLFNASKQVVVGRGGFKNDWSSLLRGVVSHNIDLVSFLNRLLGGNRNASSRLMVFLLRMKIIKMVEYIFQDQLQVVEDLFLFLVFCYQFFKQVTDGSIA